MVASLPRSILLMLFLVVSAGATDPSNGSDKSAAVGPGFLNGRVARGLLVSLAGTAPTGARADAFGELPAFCLAGWSHPSVVTTMSIGPCNSEFKPLACWEHQNAKVVKVHGDITKGLFGLFICFFMFFETALTTSHTLKKLCMVHTRFSSSLR